MSACGVSDHGRLVIYRRSARIAFESSHMKVSGPIPQKCFCRLTFSLVPCSMHVHIDVNGRCLDCGVCSMIKTSSYKSAFELKMPVLSDVLNSAWMKLEHGTRVTWHNFVILYHLSQEKTQVL